MSEEIQLVSDGDGLAVIGSPTDIERFLVSQGLDKLPSRDLGLQRLNKASSAGSVAAQAGSAIASGSGRWVQITEESAELINKYGLMTSKDTGLSLGVVQPHGGKIKGIVQFAKGPGSILGNPAILAGAAGIMAQVAIQQQMEQIVEYLQEIDEKVDDILRSQKDAVLADMIGAALIIDEAWSIREHVGRVGEVNWSKAQGTSMIIARTEAYALRQLDAIAEKLHKKAEAGELAKVARGAEVEVREWLAVLARCFQLQDATCVLELDRVLDCSPEELDQHRLGLAGARRKRRELIVRSTDRLLSEMDETVRKANSKVLFSPFKSPAAVRSSNQVVTDLHDFRALLGIESAHQPSEARPWGAAATEVRDKALATTADGVRNARRFGADTLSHAANALRPAEAEAEAVPGTLQVLSAREDADSGGTGTPATQTDGKKDARYEVFSRGGTPEGSESEANGA